MKAWVLLICLLVMSNTVVRGDRVIAENGDATDPSYAFEEDKDTGMYRPSSDSIGFTLGGAVEAVLSATRLDLNTQVRTDPGTTGSPAYLSDIDNDTGLFFPGTSQMAFSIADAERHNFNSTTYTLTSSAGAVLSLLNSNVDTTDSFINMGRQDNANDGQIQYDVGLRDMIFRVQSNDIVRIFSGGILLENASAPIIRLDSNSDTGTGTIEFGDLSLNNSGRIVYNHEVAGDFMDFYASGSPTPALKVEANNVNIDRFVNLGSTGVCIGAEEGDGTSPLGLCSSSRRFKHDIVDLPESLTVEDFRPVSFSWNETNEKDMGFIAEEVAEVAPELNTYSDGKIVGVKYTSMVAIAFAEIKRLKEENKKILARLEALENN